MQDDQFEAMYCKDNGRPSISPALLAMATILQFYRNLSDREMERACMYDIEIKYALGLKLDDRPFDHSSLGDFRERLLENGKEKEVFDRILDHLVTARLIKKNEIQRIDATHIIADIAIPTMVMLIKKGVFEILKQLKGRHREAYTRIEKEVALEEYDKERVHQEEPGRLDMETKRRKLVEVVTDAKTVLMHTKNIKTDGELRRRIEMLRRILQENIEEGKEGDPQEIDYKEKPKDLMVSPIDADARYGVRSERKRFGKGGQA
jgi:transposase